jgi:UDPglucose 6-dehydrogenase
MNITIIGTGYVGLVTGTCLADLGNDVVCLDVSEEKIRMLESGEMPIYEPGLEDLVLRNTQAKRLQFTTDSHQAIQHGDVIFIAVGTPPGEDGSADLSHVLGAARQIGQWMRNDKVIVNKSTVPVGTADRVEQVIADELNKRGIFMQQLSGDTADCIGFSIVSNPEFLKEGAAIEDFMRPDRIVLGVANHPKGEWALELMKRLYAPFNRHHERLMVMSQRSAELTKYAANAMLATRISFMNELANLAEDLSADIESVRKGIGSDPRIGYSFLYAGTGYGGSCFPKDVSALNQMAIEHGKELKILQAVEQVNSSQKLRLLKKIEARFGNDLSGLQFGVWGLAFKPETDDMREAPSRVLIKALIQRGAKVCIHDPVALEAARDALKQDLSMIDPDLNAVIECAQAYEACKGSSALIIMTEWKSYRSPDFAQLKNLLINPLIFDGRNLFEPSMMHALGFDYEGIGRLNHEKMNQAINPLTMMQSNTTSPDTDKLAPISTP